MNTGLKIGIGLLAALGAGAAYLYRSTKQVISDFTYDVVGFGKPSVSKMVLTVPVQIRFRNPAIIPVNIDRLMVDLYVLKNSTFVHAGKIDQTLSIPRGESIQMVYPQVDLASIFKGNIFDTVLSVADVISNRRVTVKADINFSYKGVSIPTQSIPPKEIIF